MMKKSKKAINYAIRYVIVVPFIPLALICSFLNYLNDNCDVWASKIKSILRWLPDWCDKHFPIKDSEQ